MKIDKVTIISGVVAGGVTYFVSKKNWKLAIVGLVVGGVAGYLINQQMNKPKSIPMPVVDNSENEEQSSFDESVEPRFQWNPIINQMMPVGEVNEVDASNVFDIRKDGLDLNFG